QEPAERWIICVATFSINSGRSTQNLKYRCGDRRCPTSACRRRLPASAPASLPLSAAPDAQRWAANIRLHHSVLSLQEVWRIYSRGNAMTLEEVVVAKLQQLPENARQQLLVLID